MKFHYEILPDRQLIVLRYAGAVDLGDFIASAETMWRDPGYVVTFDGLVDLTDLRLAVSVSDTRRLAHFVSGRALLSRGRWAAVIASPTATALAFLYQHLLGSRHRVEIFSTWEAACDHLQAKVERPSRPAA